MLCKYKDALGEPRKGVHSIRIFDFAAIDILLTVLVSVIISKTLNINVLLILIILLIIGIYVHRSFCVKTKLN